METLYEKYKNIQKFITQYRKYKLVDSKFYEFKTFKKTIQVEQYIYHKCINPINNKSVYVYIFTKNSKFVKTTAQFKRLIDRLSEDEQANVIIISKNELSIYIKKALLKYKHLQIFNYVHKLFAIEIPKGPYCSKHTILTNDEVRVLCSNQLIIHPLSLSAISINDPQNIWVGGELGDVIEIDSISEITGKTIPYRIVSPDSGKLVNVNKIDKKLNTYVVGCSNENDVSQTQDKKIKDVVNVDTSNYIYDDDDCGDDDTDDDL
jgi:DNA-directed RNA polymerase subunit H (RpoH/RPB5)